MADADSVLQTDHSAFKSSIADQRAYVTDSVESFTDSMQQVTEKLQQQSQHLDQFLADELKKDVPTGIYSLFISFIYLFSLFVYFLDIVLIVLLTRSATDLHF